MYRELPFVIHNITSNATRSKEIGGQLFISPNTVHNHIRHIYERSQVHSNTEAVVKYLKK
jgi:DNA-binding CsgD family transcriptional regulator